MPDPTPKHTAPAHGKPAASTGDYAVRLKMPDGYRIAPHWHPRGRSRSVWETPSTRTRWDHSPQAASPISIPTCITTRWLPEKSSCRSTAARPCSLTMSIPQTTRARSKSLD